MDSSSVFWIAAFVISAAAVWLTVPRQQTWFRGCALLCLLASFALAAAGYSWSSLAAQLLCMKVTFTAWHQRCLWMASLRNKLQPPAK